MNKPRPGEDRELIQVKSNRKLLELRQKPRALEAEFLVYSPLPPTSVANAAATLPPLPPPQLLEEAPS